MGWIFMQKKIHTRFHAPVTSYCLQFPELPDLWGHHLKLEDLGNGFPEIKKNGKGEKNMSIFLWQKDFFDIKLEV